MKMKQKEEGRQPQEQPRELIEGGIYELVD